MITQVKIYNFKLFEEERIDLDDSVLLVGPNNSGKTTLLQAIATWYFGLQRWIHERDKGSRAKKRTGVPITRKEFTVLPLREMNLLWTNRQTALSKPAKAGTPNLIEITLEGTERNTQWTYGLEFQYANPEMVYVRPAKAKTDEKSLSVPGGAKNLRVVHIPPFSGIGAEEPKHDFGYQNLLIGQGRPGEVIRNLLLEISESGEHWDQIVREIQQLFGINLEKPLYALGQPFITCEYRPNRRERSLDIANIGSGSLQVIMLLAFFYARPATVMLLDEPDAHLHIILQREVYDLLRKVAYDRDCQLIIGTHSEVLLDSTDSSRIISLIGRETKRLDSHVERNGLREALKRLQNVDLMLGKEVGGVLYLEGASDERILREWARIFDHPARKFLEHSYVHHLGGRSLRGAKDHFFALKAAFPEIRGLCILDGDNRDEPDEETTRIGLRVLRWHRYEIENYLLIPDAIKKYANPGSLFESIIDDEFWKQVPQGTQLFSDHVALTRIKASTEFITPLLEKVGKPTPPKDLYLIASKMKKDEIHPEIADKLNAIAGLCS